MLWDTEITQAGDGRAVLTARKPLSTCDTERALATLGMDNTRGARWTLFRLRQEGLIRGEQIGAVKKRRDGRASNAKITWDVESLIRHRQRVREREIG